MSELLAYVRLERMFVLAFGPILVVVASVYVWRWWKHINKSQR